MRGFAVKFVPKALAIATFALLSSMLSVASAQDPPTTGISLSVNPAAVSESSGTTEITVTAQVGTAETLDASTDITVWVLGHSTPGRASAYDIDFATVSNFTISLAAGATSATGTFDLTVTDDAVLEGPETIFIYGTGASLPVTRTTLTINDNDIELKADPAEVSESPGTTAITVTASVGSTATLTAATTVTVSVTGGSSGGRATAGADFTAVSDFTINLAAGATSATGAFNIIITDDTASEGPETITISGTATSTGPSLAVIPGTLTINDDDKIPALDATGCTDGTHVTSPASNAGLVADCQNLVAARNYWTNHAANVNLSHNNKLRTWTGNITTWNSITIIANRVFRLSLEPLNTEDANQHISGIIPAELGNLTNLTQLQLDWNKLTGSIPAELGNLTNLNYLGLTNNRLTGEIPTLPGSLTQLYLNVNRLTGEIPAELGNLANLTQLYLNHNRLTGTIPAELGNLANLTQLGLNHNRLSGTIPAELGNLANLAGLLLNDNRLTGGIPAELGNLANLTQLGLNHNRLTGGIPAELGNLANLADLDLNDNRLSGTIPAELGNLANLVHLLLHNNRLSGTIPAELGNPPLDVLRIDNNRLTGTLDVLSTLSPTIIIIHFCGNYLTGAVPAMWPNYVSMDFKGDPGDIGKCRRIDYVPPPPPPPPPPPDFKDVDKPEDKAAAAVNPLTQAVDALSRAGIIRGCATDPPRFCPNQPVTRSQMARLLYRSAAYRTGIGAPYAGRVTLTDVPADATWHNAAQWAASTRVMPPTPDGEFNPAGIVTRADAAVILAAAFEHLGLTSVDLSAEPQNLFTDLQGLPDTTVTAIEALYQRRITLGCAADPLRFCPEQPITRAQTATMLARTLRLTPTPEPSA